MKLKICGMTRQADLNRAEELGFDFCGFIFHPASPRNVTPEQAANLESGRMQRVGVFVKQNVAEILAIMRRARLDFAQLHGSQTAEDSLKIGPERVIRVIWPERHAAIDELEREAAAFPCAWYLLDSGLAGGGSGNALAWEACRNLDLPAPWFLAGGISDSNVKSALAGCSPFGLDCNSGLEAAPGQKDPDRMAALIDALTGMEAR